MPYTEKQVDRGRKLVTGLDKNKWALGDLALEVAPEIVQGMDWNTSPAKTELEEFADAIGVSSESLREYRTVAMTFPAARRRADVSWTVHRDLRNVDNPVRVLHQRKSWTATTAREFLGRGQAHVSAGHKAVSTPPLSRHDRVAAAREVMADADLAREVLADPGLVLPVARAQAAAAKDAHEARNRDRALADPDDDARRQADAAHTHRTVLASQFSQAVRDGKANGLRAIDTWSELDAMGAKGDWVERVEEVINVWTALKEALTTGKSLDEGLRLLLEG